MKLSIDIPDAMYEMILKADDSCIEFLNPKALIDVVKNGQPVSSKNDTPIFTSHKKAGRPSHECFDHTGRKFPSKLARNAFYGFKSNTIEDRIKCGWSLEKACTTPIIKDVSGHRRKNNNFHNSVACTDHLGNQYDTITMMCETYGIPIRIYHNRKSKGWELKERLTVPVGARRAK